MVIEMQKQVTFFLTLICGLYLATLSRCSDPQATAILEDAMRQVTGGTSTVSRSLTQFEIETGRREALQVGTDRVAARLGSQGGFWTDSTIRIPLPDKLASVRDNLDRVGLAAPFDDLHARTNAAAERAMLQVKSVFASAISQMTLQGVMAIFRGEDGAATTFFREKTEAQLKTSITPVIENALKDASVFQILDNLGQRYQLNLLVGVLKTNFTDHAVDFGIDAIFFYLAQEEAKIRQDPIARTTKILRRVFGTAT